MIFGTQVHKIETKTKFKSVTLNQMLSELLHFVIFYFNLQSAESCIEL